ncbi:MAG: ABC transporter permease [Candidatus Omnitrophota bacterium]
MMRFFRKVIAFLKRDILESSSYKFSYVFGVVGIVGSLVFFFFLSKLISQEANTYLAPYGGSYFAYVIIGIAFSGYVNFSSGIFGNLLEGEQDCGTLEAILVSPSRIGELAFANSVWSFLFTTINVAAYLLLGSIFFGLDVSKANVPSVVVIVVVSCVPLFLIGTIASSITLITKQSNFMDMLTGRISMFLAGLYMPVAVFPAWMAKVSRVLPLTHSLEALRKSALTGAGVRDVLPDLLYLALVSILLAPVSIIMFRYGFKKAKLYGNLVHR